MDPMLTHVCWSIQTAAQVGPLPIYQRQVNNVTYPYLVGCSKQSLPQQQICTNAFTVSAIGGAGNETPGLDSSQALLLHQSSHLVPPNAVALLL